MGHTTEIIAPCRPRSRELDVRRVRPAQSLQVAVRYEPIPAVREAELERRAVLERLEQLRRRMTLARRLGASRREPLEPLC